MYFLELKSIVKFWAYFYKFDNGSLCLPYVKNSKIIRNACIIKKIIFILRFCNKKNNNYNLV